MLYIKRLLSSKDDASMKRFIVFFTSLHFMLASYLVLFGIVRATVDKDMMKFILDCDFYIILVGLGVIGAENIASVLATRAQVLGSILSSKKTTTTQEGTATTPATKIESSVTTTSATPVAGGGIGGIVEKVKEIINPPSDEHGETN